MSPPLRPMSSPTVAAGAARSLRDRCRGVLPLTARLEPWELDLCRKPDRLAAWIDEHGSPLHLIDTSPMARNVAELRAAAAAADVALKIFFARKANKALAFVDEASRLGLGVDVASERELSQTLGRGVLPAEIVVTAAVKPAGLLELCAATGPTVVLDNEDEVDALAASLRPTGRRVPVALRLAPRPVPGRRETRFGLGGGELLDLVDRRWTSGLRAQLPIAGVHFHLDGYAATDRVAALGESFELVDALRARDHDPRFVDFGGGIPITYLDDAGEWDRFWDQHRAAVRAERAPLTFEGHGLGLTAHDGVLSGRPNVYPYHQQLTRGDWLARVLDGALRGGAGSDGGTDRGGVGSDGGTDRGGVGSDGAVDRGGVGATTVAEAARTRGLELRCEPGRSLADGCGMTAARVEFRKQRRDGTWLIGLAMNRTQCRSTSDDFLVDPLVVRPSASSPDPPRATGPIEGFLVGAYCIERELLTWRRLCFPHGVDVGDLVVFPNTAGYLMHILESPSHQIPLARNLIVGGPNGAVLDAIERVDPRE
jgi:diaminopimelate decarboxylase